MGDAADREAEHEIATALAQVDRIVELAQDGLWAALLRAQADFPVIVRGKTAQVETRGGGTYSYSYADLGDIQTTVGPVLRAQGLVVTQPIVETERGTAIATTIVHVPSGEREVFEFHLPIDGLAAQSVGSLITYWRRYALQAALGITTESDSDAADVNVPRRTRAPQSAGPRRTSRQSAQTSGPSVGVLWEDLKNLASALEAGKDEWEHWKLDNDWSRVMAADGGRVTEAKRDKIVEALRVVREIRANERAAAGEEPFFGEKCPECGAPGEEHMSGCSRGDWDDDSGNPYG